jgi:ribosomal protein S17
VIKQYPFLLLDKQPILFTKKIIRVSKKYLAHDAENTIAVGENVKIQETKPLSKNKSWEIIK